MGLLAHTGRGDTRQRGDDESGRGGKHTQARGTHTHTHNHVSHTRTHNHVTRVWVAESARAKLTGRPRGVWEQ